MSSNGRPPVIVRKNHGRGHSYYVDGVKQLGATSVLSQGFPRFLDKWAAESSAWYALDHWDELAEASRQEAFQKIAGARFEDRDSAARRGQDVHALAEQYLAGAEIEPPDELVGHVDAYVKFVEEWKPRELLVEATVANVTRGYCGTLDVVADLADGARWLYDIKTSRTGVFQEAALQLAAYRFAEWLLVNDEVGPMVEVDRCGVLWLRPDRTYEFVPVDASEASFVVFLYALGIAKFREREDVLLGAYTEGPTGVPS